MSFSVRLRWAAVWHGCLRVRRARLGSGAVGGGGGGGSERGSFGLAHVPACTSGAPPVHCRVPLQPRDVQLLHRLRAREQAEEQQRRSACQERRAWHGV